MVAMAKAVVIVENFTDFPRLLKICQTLIISVVIAGDLVGDVDCKQALPIEDTLQWGWRLWKLAEVSGQQISVQFQQQKVVL